MTVGQWMKLEYPWNLFPGAGMGISILQQCGGLTGLSTTSQVYQRGVGDGGYSCCFWIPCNTHLYLYLSSSALVFLYILFVWLLFCVFPLTFIVTWKWTTLCDNRSINLQ